MYIKYFELYRKQEAVDVENGEHKRKQIKLRMHTLYRHPISAPQTLDGGSHDKHIVLRQIQRALTANRRHQLRFHLSQLGLSPPQYVFTPVNIGIQ